MIIVSSCLAGVEVRYYGTHSLNDKIRKLVEENKGLLYAQNYLVVFQLHESLLKL